MKYANKIGADYSVIIGENELKEGRIRLKDMKDGEDKEMELKDLVSFFKA